MYYESDHPIWAPQKGTFRSHAQVNVSDGKVTRVFYAKGLGDPNQQEGLISDRANFVKHAVILPFTMLVRGVDSSICGYPIKDLSPSTRTMAINGVTCQEFTCKLENEEIARFWLDSKADYVVRRIRRDWRTTPLEQFDIAYSQDGASLQSWVRATYSAKGKLLRKYNVEVKEMTAAPALPPDFFDLKFPAGTFVRDARSAKAFRVQADLTMRELSKETGEELPGTVEQLELPWLYRHFYLLITLGIVVGVLVALLVVMRRSRRVRSSQA
ncbi:MAG: hypothetical protein U0791_12020 [Gemmataceae bacterium]